MLRFVVKRIGLSIMTLIMVSLIVFLMTSILPGDIAKQTLGRDATPEAYEIWNKERHIYFCNSNYFSELSFFSYHVKSVIKSSYNFFIFANFELIC
jgi:ABC-type dipeptide/oligopeptide/nickel transport system permease component